MDSFVVKSRYDGYVYQLMEADDFADAERKAEEILEEELPGNAKVWTVEVTDDVYQ